MKQNDDDDNDDQHISSDGEKLKRSLVSFQPSTESDENFSDESQHRHILKIQISPTTAVKAIAKTRNSSSSEIVDNSKLNKSSSIIVNSNNSKSKKMSVVSGNRCENDSIYRNVTIIRNSNSSNNDDNEFDDDQYEKDEYDIENLSDDQKLVLNGHHITVKCGSGSAKINNNKLIRNKTSEIIQLSNGHSGSENIMNIVNSNDSNGIILNSGQCSPEECISVNGEDHIDSGTCSDVEVNGLTCGSGGFDLITKSMSSSPPPLPPKGMKKIPKLSESTFSDASSASSSSDSMQYQHQQIDDQLKSPDLIRSIENSTKYNQSIKNKENDMISGLLPTTLLHDIRNHSMKAFLQSSLIHGEDDDDSENDIVLQYDSGELNYSEIDFSTNEKSVEEVNNKEVVIKEHFAVSNKNNKTIVDFFEDDKFYKFHLNENSSIENDKSTATHEESDESFAGYKDLRSGTSTIRSAKGTIRGVKNRVRNGIATFLQMQQSTIKNFKEKDGGKIVLYTTSMGVVRSTYAKCQAMKQILRTLMVKFEERDVFMCFSHQKEIRERMQSDDIDVPQLFVDGHYIGNADQVERLNETGELRMMLKPFKTQNSLTTCNMCGGYKMLPCTSCGGSKKSIHRNHFTAEFIALKCMNCDEVGLVKCYNCA
ncbi:glutaredoxin domain-containing cysteine-rich protein CG31559-like [Chironomus tepperi]|uniref:glutaredoxin domain-containing cysteine-rich protein CG31559-like n=1 Tax=Chironomus tepperi TaxID=113505 RepID=UPI00391F20B7